MRNYLSNLAPLSVCFAILAGCAAAPNPSYCDQDTPCSDPEQAHCQLELNQCTATPPGPPCDSASECTGETAPLCIDDMCTGCIDDRECSQFADRSYCRDDGACVGCLSSDDCGAIDAPICDPDLFACRPCQDHGECKSGVCQLEEGSCLAQTAIVYVSPGGDDDGPCSLDAPCRTLGRGITQVTDERHLIMAAAGDYVDNLVITVPVTIWASDVHLFGHGSDEPAIEIVGDINVTIEGMGVRNALGDSDLAAGIACAGGAQLLVAGVTIENNAGDGIRSSDCSIEILDSSIAGNSQGSGLAIDGGDISLVASTIEANQTGIEVVDGNVTLDEVTVSDQLGPGLSLGLGSQATVRQSTIAGNRGHGIYVVHGATVDVRRSTVRGNRAGGLYGQDAEVIAVNNFIAGNGRPATSFPTQSGPSGDGGIRLEEGNHLRSVRGHIEHNTVVDNYGDRDAGAAGIVCIEPAAMAMRNNLVAHNTVDPPNLSPEIPAITAQVAGTCSHTHTLGFPQAPSGTGNIQALPEFVDRQAGDYHLRSSSPGVSGAATTDLTVDFDGDSRPSGAGADVGADESSP